MRKSDRLFQVDLTLTADNDKDLHVLTDHIREETFSGVTGWDRLGILLLAMGESEKAQAVYEVLLHQAKSEGEQVSI
jgi:hypothetical protein